MTVAYSGYPKFKKMKVSERMIVYQYDSLIFQGHSKKTKERGEKVIYANIILYFIRMFFILLLNPGYYSYQMECINNRLMYNK
jgi:hypothetical protein